MPSMFLELPTVQRYLRAGAPRLIELVREDDFAAEVATFWLQLRLELNRFRQKDGGASNATAFRLNINRLICRLVLRAARADCVFIRRLQTDGSVRLFGTTEWLKPLENCRPPDVKERNEGVSGKILNSGHAIPRVIPQVNAEGQEFYEEHLATRERYSQLSPEYDFVSRIRAECCIPIQVQSQTLAGVVAVRWQAYTGDEVGDVESRLRDLQGSIEDLYYAGLQLERRELLQDRIVQVTRALAATRAPVAPEALLRRFATLLTCDAGLRWHRVFVFLFDAPYPAGATCVLAVGGTGLPTWSAHQSKLGGRNLGEYLGHAEAPDYGADDPLHRWVVGEPRRLVVPLQGLRAHQSLAGLFDAPGSSGPGGRNGPVQLPPGPEVLPGLTGSQFLCATGARHCPRHVVPLYRPLSQEPLGFVVLDNPYPHPREDVPDLGSTGLIGELFASHLVAAGLTPGDWQARLSPSTKGPAAPKPRLTPRAEEEESWNTHREMAARLATAFGLAPA